MDPLTHTLVGANLAASRLGEKSRFAAAALIVGANLPDVDAILYFTGHDDLARGFRRGWTHGVLALVVLPFVLTALLVLYDRWRPHATRRADPRWLLILSALAILTHPFLDWLNNYGMRWLMPFRGTWSYGDSVYIMDPWLWLILGGGWLAGREPSPRLIANWAAFALAIAWVVGRRSTSYLPVVAIVAVVLLLALLRKPRAGGWSGARFATVALTLAAAYIAMRLGIHAVTAARVHEQIADTTGTRAERLMVAPHPIDPTRWDVVAEVGDVYRYGRFSWRAGGLSLADEQILAAKDSPAWDAARRDPSIQGFVTWMRFPWYRVDGKQIFVGDARYAVRTGRRGLGGVIVTMPDVIRR